MSNNSQTSPTTRIDKVALHQKVKPAGDSANPLTLGKNVEEQILQIVSGNFNEKVVRTKFVQMALATSGVVGACYLSKDQQDLWSPSVSTPSSGRIPERRKFAEELSSKCDEFAKSSSVQTAQIASIGGQSGLFAPIRPRNTDPEILLVVLQSPQAVLSSMQTVQKIASAIQLWLNSRDSADADWQVQALAAIVEIVAKVENQETNKAAAEEIANLLANRLGCGSAAVGLIEKHRMNLNAISGVGKIDKGSAASSGYLQTLVESSTRKQPGVFPAVDENNNFLLQAHKQLAATVQSEAVYSFPLTTDDEQTVGSVILTGNRALLASNQFKRFTDTAAPSLANSLRVVNKIKQTTLSKTKSYVKRKLSFTKQLFILASLVGFVMLMFLPITYRVRCNCVTEPVSRRFAVAPFDGQILAGLVEAGDIVSKGQVLAEMDGRKIRWDLAGVTAERKQSIITRGTELKDRNVPKARLAELEFDRLVSEESILQYHQENLKIKSPIDGVVLSGSLERAEAASIETGQVLFEIGPVKPMSVEVAIPAEEIAQIKVGYSAKIWIDGQEDEPLTGEIKKIHPRSETRDAKNVFIAELEFENEDERLRPGMKGSARLDGERRSLGWSLFHKPVNYVRSRLTWW
jgi:biotin carboxyl carrier protein